VFETRQRVQRTTDSQMEQGLEVGGNAAVIRELVATPGNGETKARLNGERAKVAVTRHGYRRGETFGGCESRDWGRQPRRRRFPQGSRRREGSWKRLEPHD